jgi:hypothetical protein
MVNYLLTFYFEIPQAIPTKFKQVADVGACMVSATQVENQTGAAGI